MSLWERGRGLTPLSLQVAYNAASRCGLWKKILGMSHLQILDALSEGECEDAFQESQGYQVSGGLRAVRQHSVNPHSFDSLPRTYDTTASHFAGPTIGVLGGQGDTGHRRLWTELL